MILLWSLISRVFAGQGSSQPVTYSGAISGVTDSAVAEYRSRDRLTLPSEMRNSPHGRRQGAQSCYAKVSGAHISGVVYQDSGHTVYRTQLSHRRFITFENNALQPYTRFITSPFRTLYSIFPFYCVNRTISTPPACHQSSFYDEFSRCRNTKFGVGECFRYNRYYEEEARHAYPVQHSWMQARGDYLPYPYRMPARNTYEGNDVKYERNHCNLVAREWDVVETMYYASLVGKYCLVDQNCFVRFDTEMMGRVYCIRPDPVNGGFEYFEAAEHSSFGGHESRDSSDNKLFHNLDKLSGHFMHNDNYTPLTLDLRKDFDSHWQLTATFQSSVPRSGSTSKVQLRFFENNNEFIHGTECFQNIGSGLRTLVPGSLPYEQKSDNGVLAHRVLPALSGKSIPSDGGFTVNFLEPTFPFRISIRDYLDVVHGPFSAVFDIVLQSQSEVRVRILCPQSLKGATVPMVNCDVTLNPDFTLSPEATLRCINPYFPDSRTLG